MPSRRIAIIGPSRSAVAEPFSGGLAAHVWALTAGLVERGHDVTLFAAPGSDPQLPVRELAVTALRLSDDARRDVSMPSDVAIREHHAYLKLMLELAADAEFDVIHNHSLHYLPVAMAAAVSIPMVTTLHTPPTPWLESAVQAAGCSPMRFVAVSGYTDAAMAGGASPGGRHPERGRPAAVADGARRRPGRVDRPDRAREGATPGRTGSPGRRAGDGPGRPDRRCAVLPLGGRAAARRRRRTTSATSTRPPCAGSSARRRSRW